VASPSLKIIREWLIADTSDSLYDDVGTRIDTIGLFDEFNQPANSKPHIVMARRGGEDSGLLATAKPSILFKVFSGRGSITEDTSGPLRAAEIYENVKSRLHNINNKTTTSGYIISAFEQQQPQDLIDPDTGWAYVQAFYIAHTRDLS
jgi:hypothetical protein